MSIDLGLFFDPFHQFRNQAVHRFMHIGERTVIVDDKIRLLPFFFLGHLNPHQRLGLFPGNAIARRHPFNTALATDAYHDHKIKKILQPGLEKKRHLDPHYRITRLPGVFKFFRHPRDNFGVNVAFEPLFGRRIPGDDAAQHRPVYPAVRQQYRIAEIRDNFSVRSGARFDSFTRECVGAVNRYAVRLEPVTDNRLAGPHPAGDGQCGRTPGFFPAIIFVVHCKMVWFTVVVARTNLFTAPVVHRPMDERTGTEKLSKKLSISKNVRDFNINFIPRKPGVYIVGGTVRDLLLDRCPQDYDIAAFCPPEAVADQIAQAAGGRPVRIGKGDKAVYRIVTPKHTYDISAGRGESIADDLAARDFTVNAMAVDVTENRLIDLQNGRRDLASRIIRMVSPGVFADDPLRLLRAFRMAAGLGFSIEPDTLSTIKKMTGTIRETAGERIRDEWLKLIANPDSVSIIEQMDATGLLGAVFPELLPMKGCVQNGHHRFDVFFHSLSVFRKVEQLIDTDRPALSSEYANREMLHDGAAHALIKHAALFHDIGKPGVRTVDHKGRIHFYGHGKTGAEMAAGISERLRMANREKRYIDAVIHHHLYPLSLYLSHTRKELSRRARTRFFHKTGPFSPDLIVLSTADMLGKGIDRNASDYIDFARQLLDAYFSDYRPASEKPPLISGHDLIEQFNLAPSHRFAGILHEIEIERLAGRICSREEAIAAVKKILDFQNRS